MWLQCLAVVRGDGRWVVHGLCLALTVVVIGMSVVGMFAGGGDTDGLNCDDGSIGAVVVAVDVGSMNALARYGPLDGARVLTHSRFVVQSSEMVARPDIIAVPCWTAPSFATCQIRPDRIDPRLARGRTSVAGAKAPIIDLDAPAPTALPVTTPPAVAIPVPAPVPRPSSTPPATQPQPPTPAPIAPAAKVPPPAKRMPGKKQATPTDI